MQLYPYKQWKWGAWTFALLALQWSCGSDTPLSVRKHLMPRRESLWCWVVRRQLLIACVAVVWLLWMLRFASYGPQTHSSNLSLGFFKFLDKMNSKLGLTWSVLYLFLEYFLDMENVPPRKWWFCWCQHFLNQTYHHLVCFRNVHRI